MKSRSVQHEGHWEESLPDLSGVYQSAFCGKRVLVTGAGGSVGRRLVTQLTHLSPERIAAVDKDENGIFELEREFANRSSSIPLESFIADLRDAGHLSDICKAFSPHIIFHAAAYKHVSLMERHPCEAILGNVLGTLNLLNIAPGLGVERLVYVSTVSAINPTNVMGATKRIGEMLVRSAGKSGRIRTASIRLVNVAGSRGSVIPLFQLQISRGGPITVTHPEASRCFISLKRAVQLILSAGAEAKEGEIYFSDAGKPRRIRDLARALIFLSGADPERDIHIRFVGLGLGEKLTEEVISRTEKPARTRIDGLCSIEQPVSADRSMHNQISQLIQSARGLDRESIYRILAAMPLGFNRIPERRSAPDEREAVDSVAENDRPLPASHPEENAAARAAANSGSAI